MIRVAIMAYFFSLNHWSKHHWQNFQKFTSLANVCAARLSLRIALCQAAFPKVPVLPVLLLGWAHE